MEAELYPPLIENRQNDIAQLQENPEFVDAEYLKLNDFGKKYAREKRYELWNGDLDENLFYSLKRMCVASIEKDYQKYKYYRGCITWNEQEISKIALKLGVQQEYLQQILQPKGDLTYEDIERILSYDPNFLVSIMTLFSKNYSYIYDKAEEDRGIRTDPIKIYILPFMFTANEEKIFLMGRELLKNLNKRVDSEYIRDLIKEINSVIYKFNQLLIRKVVNKHRGRIEDGDSYQAGSYGFLRGLNRFDVDRNTRFSTYVTWWIRQAVTREEANSSNTIRIPVHMRPKLKQYHEVEGSIRALSKVDPSFEEVIEQMGENGKSSAKSLKKVLKVQGLASLDKEFENDEDNNSLHSLIPDPSPSIEEILADNNTTLFNKVATESHLTPREEQILGLRYGFSINSHGESHTLQEISEKFGLTRERIRQIEVKALKKIRRRGVLIKREFQPFN